MSVSFDEGVFGKDNTNITPTPDFGSDKKGSKSCSLGECGMSHRFEAVNSENMLHFDWEFSATGSSTLNLAGLNIRFSEDIFKIKFSCSYSLNVQVTTDEFSVVSSSKEHAHQLQGTGQLDDGFTISLNNNVAGVHQITLGGIEQVNVNWDLNISDVEFYIRDCEVTEDQNSISIIKEVCDARVLSVKSLSPNSFEYRTFTFASASLTSTLQQISCDLKICNGAGCAHAERSANQNCEVNSPYNWLFESF